jgi:hypothetical protein
MLRMAQGWRSEEGWPGVRVPRPTMVSTIKKHSTQNLGQVPIGLFDVTSFDSSQLLSKSFWSRSVVVFLSSS